MSESPETTTSQGGGKTEIYKWNAAVPSRKVLIFLHLDAPYSVNTDFCETMFADGVHCTVTKSENNDPLVGLNAVFQVEQVKKLIIQFLDILRTNIN